MSSSRRNASISASFAVISRLCTADSSTSVSVCTTALTSFGFSARVSRNRFASAFAATSSTSRLCASSLNFAFSFSVSSTRVAHFSSLASSNDFAHAFLAVASACANASSESLTFSSTTRSDLASSDSS